MAQPLRITLPEGDQTGQELLEQSLRVLDPDLLRLEIELVRFDGPRRADARHRTASSTRPPRSCARPASGSRRPR